MYFSIQEGDKSYWTHSSLIDEQNFEKIKQIHNGVPSFRNTLSFFTLYGTLEAVNRVKQLKSLNIYYRAAAVVVPTLLARFASPSLYWVGKTSSINQLLDGAPVWEKKQDVPELDKLYFFLDDDNNYEPNLWHHGVTAPRRPQKIYKFGESQ